MRIVRSSTFSDFLAFCAGADPFRSALTPSQRVYRQGAGALVLFTSIIAAAGADLTGMEICHCSWYAGLPAALVWGLGIFAVDRWLVGSTRTGSAAANSPANGRPNAANDAWRTYVPRLVVAFLVGANITDAIVLRMFAPEINQILARNAQAAHKRAEAEIDARPVYRQIAADRAEIARTQDQLQKMRAARDVAYQEMLREHEGLSATGKFGRGPVYAEKKALADTAAAEYRSAEAAATTRVAALYDDVARLGGRRAAELAEINAVDSAATGNIARLKALGVLLGSSWLVGFRAVTLWLLIMMIDCLPVLTKILQAGYGKHPEERLREEQEQAEIDAGTAAIRGMARHAAGIEEERQKIEREAATRMNQSLATQLEQIQDELIQAHYLPAARAKMEQEMREHIARMAQRKGMP